MKNSESSETFQFELIKNMTLSKVNAKSCKIKESGKYFEASL